MSFQTKKFTKFLVSTLNPCVWSGRICKRRVYSQFKRVQWLFEIWGCYLTNMINFVWCTVISFHALKFLSRSKQTIIYTTYTIFVKKSTLIWWSCKLQIEWYNIEFNLYFENQMWQCEQTVMPLLVKTLFQDQKQTTMLKQIKDILFKYLFLYKEIV
jgi:hypothetical protein